MSRMQPDLSAARDASGGIVHRMHTAGMLPISVARNVWCARRLSPFSAARFGTFRIEALADDTYRGMACLYEDLNHRPIAPDKRLLLALLGPKLALVARDEASSAVVGLAYYYFNTRDRREGTIHVGFSGVAEAVRGCGLGTFMRRHALVSFAAAGLRGVSTRISVSNGISQRVNEKLGFTIVETYFDDARGELRHYMVCDLENLRNDWNQGLIEK